jgi:copper homeostasis protein
VLTSGGAARSVDGVDAARLVARGDVEIMAGAASGRGHPAILASGVDAVHLSARRQDSMRPGPGGGPGHDVTDPASSRGTRRRAAVQVERDTLSA